MRVQCPTLITATPHDGGVSYAHAENLAAHIVDARLVTIATPTHLLWLGPGSRPVTS